MAQNKGKPTRFIRRNGRIIPIFSKDYNKDPYAASAKAGLAGGALIGAGAVTAQAAKSKVGKVAGFTALGVGGSYAALQGINKIISAYKKGGKKEGGGFTGWLGTSFTSGISSTAAEFASAGLAASAIIGAKKVSALKRLKRMKK